MFSQDDDSLQRIVLGRVMGDVALMAAGLAEHQIDVEKPQHGTGSGSEAEARRVEIGLEP